MNCICGHTYEDHVDYFGKVCFYCGAFIPASIEMPIVKENRRKYDALIETLRNYLKKKYGEKNANFKRQHEDEH